MSECQRWWLVCQSFSMPESLRAGTKHPEERRRDREGHLLSSHSASSRRCPRYQRALWPELPEYLPGPRPSHASCPHRHTHWLCLPHPALHSHPFIVLSQRLVPKCRSGPGRLTLSEETWHACHWPPVPILCPFPLGPCLNENTGGY